MDPIRELIKLAKDLISVGDNRYDDGQWYKDAWNKYKKDHPKTKIKNPPIKLREEKWRDKEWTKGAWDYYKYKHPNTKIRPKFKKEEK